MLRLWKSYFYVCILRGEWRCRIVSGSLENRQAYCQMRYDRASSYSDLHLTIDEGYTTIEMSFFFYRGNAKLSHLSFLLDWKFSFFSILRWCKAFIGFSFTDGEKTKGAFLRLLCPLSSRRYDAALSNWT